MRSGITAGLEPLTPHAGAHQHPGLHGNIIAQGQDIHPKLGVGLGLEHPQSGDPVKQSSRHRWVEHDIAHQIFVAKRRSSQ